MPIEVRFAAGAKKLNAAWIKKVVARTLRAEKAKRRSVSVLLTNDRAIRKINREYLKHDTATDVIAFGSGPGTRVPAESDHLGDVVVSVQTARAVSKELKIPFCEELARYLVHGTLHLLGYDDEAKKDKMRMEARQEHILRKLLG
jgi:probable rRNA maturation factor